jgi:DNA-binding LacI/PurR family transcriptional regulator
MAQRARIRETTLKDVARATGVSVSAVSMALADHPRIGAATKEQVREAAQRLGYVRNSAARALRAQRSGAVALIVPNTAAHVFGHAYFMHLLVGLTEVANARDTAVVVSTNPDQQHGVAAYERMLRSRVADGAIVTSAAVTDRHLDRLVDSGLPVVLLGRFPRLPDAVSVGVDDVRAAAAATGHLVDAHQRTRLVHISGPLDHQSAQDRYEGFRSALTRRGLPHPRAAASGDFAEASGRRAAAQLLAEAPGFDGLFAANDEMALGAIRELQAAGLRVPEDVAVVGFDDFGLSRVVTPAIATMHVPAVDIARLAAQLLFDRLDGVAPAEPHTTLPVHLVPRASCGCPSPA